jgi:flagellin-specific chaperone FliS
LEILGCRKNKGGAGVKMKTTKEHIMEQLDIIAYTIRQRLSKEQKEQLYWKINSLYQFVKQEVKE